MISFDSVRSKIDGYCNRGNESHKTDGRTKNTRHNVSRPTEASENKTNAYVSIESVDSIHGALLSAFLTFSSPVKTVCNKRSWLTATGIEIVMRNRHNNDSQWSRCTSFRPGRESRLLRTRPELGRRNKISSFRRYIVSRRASFDEGGRGGGKTGKKGDCPRDGDFRVTSGDFSVREFF